MSSLFLFSQLKTNFIFHKHFSFGFSQKFKRGKKSFLLALSLCRSRQILGYVCRPIKGSQLTPYVQVRLTCLPSKIHVFLFNQISCPQSVVFEYSIIFIYLHVSLCKSPCSDVFSGFFLLQFKFQRALEREREREYIYIYIYIYIYSSSFVTSLLYYYFFFVCVFLRFLQYDRQVFNLSCHLFSYPLSLKQTSSFTKIIFFLIFSKNKEREKIICSFFMSLQVKTNFGLRL